MMGRQLRQKFTSPRCSKYLSQIKTWLTISWDFFVIMFWSGAVCLASYPEYVTINTSRQRLFEFNLDTRKKKRAQWNESNTKLFLSSNTAIGFTKVVVVKQHSKLTISKVGSRFFVSWLTA